MSFSNFLLLLLNISISSLYKRAFLRHLPMSWIVVLGFFGSLVMYNTCALLISIPSTILNTDAIADGSTNIVVSLFYLIYGTILLFGFINRFTKKVEVRKMKGFTVVALIGVIACYFVFAYCAFVEFLYVPITAPMGTHCAQN